MKHSQISIGPKLSKEEMERAYKIIEDYNALSWQKFFERCERQIFFRSFFFRFALGTLVLSFCIIYIFYGRVFIFHLVNAHNLSMHYAIETTRSFISRFKKIASRFCKDLKSFVSLQLSKIRKDIQKELKKNKNLLNKCLPKIRKVTKNKK